MQMSTSQKGKIQSVNGLIDPSAMGFSLMYEGVKKSLYSLQSPDASSRATM